MHREKFTRVLLVFILLIALLAGCSKKPAEQVPSGWDTQTNQPMPGQDQPQDIPTSSDIEVTPSPEVSEEPAASDVTEDSAASEEPAASDVTEDSAAEDTESTAGYLSVDLTLGRPMSKLYTYAFTPKDKAISEIRPSQKYDGFFDAKTAVGATVLLGPDMKVVEYPESDSYKVLEPFLSGGKVYFRVEDKETDWKAVSEIHSAQWWEPLGGYAVLDAKGNEVIPFGKFDYIDLFVEGKSRAYSVKDANYYIIDVQGNPLKTYPVADKIAPYKLYPYGFIYTRSDVGGQHSHALLTWDDEVVIPYDEYKDDIDLEYLGDGTFLVNNSILKDGTESGLVLYSVDKDKRKLPDDSYDVFSADDGKYITGVITNGLAGPLATWEYVVTDYAGNILIEQGKYKFTLGGWGDGYAVAKNADNKWVLLDSNCKEVKLPEYMELTGRYSYDAALFTVKVTKDFELWRYPDVPSRYDNPVGVVDKDFNWVIPPGVVDYIRNLPVTSVNTLCEYKQGDTNKGSLIYITPITAD